jgi:hypothetical protein
MLAIVVRGHDCFLLKIFPNFLGDLIMKLKAIALAASLSVFGATTFAADLDPSLTDVTAVSAGTATAPAAVQALVVTDIVAGTVTGGDISLIVQEGTTSNIAMIDQQVVDGTQLAAIVQTNTAAGAVGYISQGGSDNRAFINQHD